MTYGTLYGVGVGPGDPELVTLKAQRVMREADVLAIPRSGKFARSLAWRTAKPCVGEVPDQERLFLDFPMTKDPTILVPAWEIALAEIGARLEAGRSIAFLTAGDPFTWSTFIYLFEAANDRWPSAKVEVIPGVSSLTAISTAAGVPLADGQERFAVLPATWGLEDLPEIFQRFDTVLFIKVSSVIDDLRNRLRDMGLLECAVFVERATTTEEVVLRDLDQVDDSRCAYFSGVLVAKKSRSGVLTGREQKESAR